MMNIIKKSSILGLSYYLYDNIKINNCCGIIGYIGK